MGKNIGLLADNTPTFPSLPLMKISAYHKSRGDKVEFAQTALFAHYDIVYVSRTFNLELKTVPKIDTDYISADKFIYGGTGYAIEVVEGKEVFHKEKDVFLPREIEHIYPDYSLYPELTKNTAYGFLTRGCSNGCPFCIVPEHEGKVSRKVADLNEWWNGQKNIKLLDANMLACKDRIELLKQLINSNASIDYTQGLDARFINDEIAQLICQTKISMVHFAFDLMKNEERIVKGLKVFKKHFNKDDRHAKVYILTNFNTTFQEDLYRIRKVIELGYAPDVRIYQKQSAPQFLRDVAGWANNPIIYRSCKLEDFVPRSDGKCMAEIYNEILKGVRYKNEQHNKKTET